MNENDLLALVSPDWFVPVSRIVAGPGATAWQAPRPQVYAAAHPDGDDAALPCPEGCGVAMMAALLPGFDEVLGWAASAPDRVGSVDPAALRTAYDRHAHMIGGIADVLVAPLEDHDPVSYARDLQLWHRPSCMVLLGDDPTVVFVALGHHLSGQSYWWLLRLGLPVQSAGLRPLAGVAMWGWLLEWLGRDGHHPMTSELAGAKVPWPGTVRVTGPGEALPLDVTVRELTGGPLSGEPSAPAPVAAPQTDPVLVPQERDDEPLQRLGQALVRIGLPGAVIEHGRGAGEFTLTVTAGEKAVLLNVLDVSPGLQLWFALSEVGVERAQGYDSPERSSVVLTGHGARRLAALLSTA